MAIWPATGATMQRFGAGTLAHSKDRTRRLIWMNRRPIGLSGRLAAAGSVSVGLLTGLDEGLGCIVRGPHLWKVRALCCEIDERVQTLLRWPIEGDWPYLWLPLISLLVHTDLRPIRPR